MTRYYRLSGSGNDFLALAEPQSDPTPEEIAAWCTRGVSAGADGLFVLRRSETGLAMTYYNADGGRAALCLNGTRCAARLAFELGWTERRAIVETDAGDFEALAAGDNAVALRLPAPEGAIEHLRLTQAGRVWDCWRLDVGVPHLIVYWDRPMSEAPLATVAPALRADSGANIDFARFVDRQRLEIRSFERGVEAETLACGTGVLATVAIGLSHGRAELPVSVMTRGGFGMTVAPAPGESRLWELTADARLVARGELAPGARERPESPGW